MWYMIRYPYEIALFFIPGKIQVIASGDRKFACLSRIIVGTHNDAKAVSLSEDGLAVYERNKTLEPI